MDIRKHLRYIQVKFPDVEYEDNIIMEESEKIKLECGKWFDKSKAELIASNIRSLTSLNQLWISGKGTHIFGIFGYFAVNPCLSTMQTRYRIATKKDIKSFKKEDYLSDQNDFSKEMEV